MLEPTLEIRLRSDATRLTGDPPGILVHLLSDSLVWGLGFTQALEARWPECVSKFRTYKSRSSSIAILGEVFYTELAPNVILGHLVAERSRGNPESSLDWVAFATCLDHVATRALATNAIVHAPPLGTGLAGAPFCKVRALLESRLVTRGVSVVIHCLGNRLPQ